MLRVYLDDLRDAPEGWVRTYTVEETVALLKTGKVKTLSLDHDLGGYSHYNEELATDGLYASDFTGEKTGYDVLLWLENEVYHRRLTPPEVEVHSANSAGRKRMLAAVASIKRLQERAVPSE